MNGHPSDHNRLIDRIAVSDGYQVLERKRREEKEKTKHDS